MTFIYIAIGAGLMWYGHNVNNPTFYIEGIVIINMAIILRKRISLNHL